MAFPGRHVLTHFESKQARQISAAEEQIVEHYIRRAYLSFVVWLVVWFMFMLFYFTLRRTVWVEFIIIFWWGRYHIISLTAAVYFCCLVMLAHAQCRPGTPHTDAHMRRSTIVQSISVACRSGCLVMLAHAWYKNDTDTVTYIVTDVRTYLQSGRL